MRREDVYILINSEREYQGAMGARRVLPIEGEIILLRSYLQKAEAAYTHTFGDSKELPTMNVVRKIAAICVRCMENHETPPRKGDV